MLFGQTQLQSVPDVDDVTEAGVSSGVTTDVGADSDVNVVDDVVVVVLLFVSAGLVQPIINEATAKQADTFLKNILSSSCY